METTRTIPRVDQHHRLDIALQHANIGVAEMATFLHVGRNTISNYIHGRTRPNRATLIAWSDICGVDLDWLAGNDPGDPAITGAVPRQEPCRSPEVAGQIPLFALAA